MRVEKEGIDGDRYIVRLQLQRNKVHPYIRVVFRCRWGYPVVVLNPPTFYDKPFPTLFWLTCPFLIKEVSKMESDSSLRVCLDKQGLDNAHRSYASIRFSYLARIASKKTSFSLNSLKVIAFSGVGGVTKDMKSIKCLHSHYAFFLAGYDDPIGKAVDSLLPTKECPDRRCDSLGQKFQT